MKCWIFTYLCFTVFYHKFAAGSCPNCQDKPPTSAKDAWPISNKCNAKVNGIDSGKSPCIKFFAIYKENLGSYKSMVARNNVCKKYKSTVAMPKTCQQTQFLWRMFQPDDDGCEADKNIFLGSESLPGAFSYRWFDGTHLNTTEWEKCWLHGEPNNADGHEACLTMKLGAYNDIPCDHDESPLACEICLKPSEFNGALKMCATKTKISAHSGSCNGLVFTRPDYENKNEYPMEKFCELRPCPSFRWGPDCKYQCFCKGYEACHQDTGKCPTDECEDGFQGEHCNLNGCPTISRWGENCDKICYCKNQQSCHRTKGICALGCYGDGVGSKCSRGVLEPCAPGKYGTNCDKICNCKGTCTRTEGLCLKGCRPDWFGQKCDITECPAGRWGEQCEKICACKNEKSCNIKTGSCIGGPVCIEGWSGESCDKGSGGECDEGNGNCPGSATYTKDCPGELLWGPECMFSCKNLHCSACSRQPKWRGSRCKKCRPEFIFNEGLCDKRCSEENLWGDPCERKCSEHCAGNGSCHFATGGCLAGCKEGQDYADPLRCLMECLPLMWGPKCEFDCKNEKCLVCSKEEKWEGNRCEKCLPGLVYNDGLCDKNCTEERVYGDMCEKQCSEFCGGDGRCHWATGECLDGCKADEDYEDTARCIQQEHAGSDDKGSSLWVALTAGLIILLLALAFVAVLLMKKRGSKAQGQAMNPEDEPNEDPAEEPEEKPEGEPEGEPEEKQGGDALEEQEGSESAGTTSDTSAEQ